MEPRLEQIIDRVYGEMLECAKTFLIVATDGEKDVTYCASGKVDGCGLAEYYLAQIRAQWQAEALSQQLNGGNDDGQP